MLLVRRVPDMYEAVADLFRAVGDGRSARAHVGRWGNYQRGVFLCVSLKVTYVTSCGLGALALVGLVGTSPPRKAGFSPMFFVLPIG